MSPLLKYTAAGLVGDMAGTAASNLIQERWKEQFTTSFATTALGVGLRIVGIYAAMRLAGAK